MAESDVVPRPESGILSFLLVDSDIVVGESENESICVDIHSILQTGAQLVECFVQADRRPFCLWLSGLRDRSTACANAATLPVRELRAFALVHPWRTR